MMTPNKLIASGDFSDLVYHLYNSENPESLVWENMKQHEFRSAGSLAERKSKG